ncbi:MAG: MoxR family ATPase [Planctomycetota bacterium]|nr:MAG: MoxR family ATPase [Planctomycetota bacterium]REJ94716.1 MAG: MoxR family ATPase [Planctomycetota bacterium]
MTDPTTNPEQTEIDVESVQRLQEAGQRIATELHQVIVGQDAVVRELVISLLTGGHCLLVGVPGLAKTLMVRSLADTLGLTFSRVQFTPDLMPADIIGTEVIQEDRSTGVRELKFLKGPVFANVVLADEINRTPPKTQAALLEAMQEHQITVGGQRHLLPEPFFVLATQNPIEQEGTYPLPEAQQDRFMLQVRIDYPTEDEEFQIVRQTTTGARTQVRQVVSQDELLDQQRTVRAIPAADHVIRYALAVVRLTRKDQGDIPDFVEQYVSWGAGPRASQNLILGAKANAALEGREFASTDDVRQVAPAVLRHRIITNFNAEADGVSPDEIVRRLIETVPPDGSEAAHSGRLSRMFRSA